MTVACANKVLELRKTGWRTSCRLQKGVRGRVESTQVNEAGVRLVISSSQLISRQREAAALHASLEALEQSCIWQLASALHLTTRTR